MLWIFTSVHVYRVHINTKLISNKTDHAIRTSLHHQWNAPRWHFFGHDIFFFRNRSMEKYRRDSSTNSLRYHRDLIIKARCNHWLSLKYDKINRNRTKFPLSRHNLTCAWDRNRERRWTWREPGDDQAMTESGTTAKRCR